MDEDRDYEFNARYDYVREAFDAAGERHARELDARCDEGDDE